MNCEHCPKNPALDCGIAHSWHCLFGALGRALRSVLNAFAQLG